MMDSAVAVPVDEQSLHAVAQRILGFHKCDVFIDVGPLLDEHWTGIPVAAAALTRVLRKAFDDQLRFVIGGDEIEPAAVHHALARSTGLFLSHDINQGHGRLGPARPAAPERPSIGLFPTVKSSRRIFDFECSIIHDISTLITPHFHTPENISYHMESLLEDLASNTVTACVSQATARDLIDYLGADPARLIIADNGLSWRPQDFQSALSDVDKSAVEPFFIILGTREPRKNIALIADLLQLFPELLDEHRFVVTGKQGWLQDGAEFPANLQGAMESGRLFFTGFLSDAEKCKLLMAADASIYPSFFEGFGLPVVESLSVGTACIASCSSSIPEVGGPFCSYFDPYSVLDLHRAILKFKQSRRRDAAFRAACIESVARFTWVRTAHSILSAMAAHIT
jgi:hypothetical protein